LGLPYLQVELKTGETYRGTLVEAEDNWNSQMKDITVTGRVRTPARRRTSSAF
jgi:small nuclear ribonucleoprotein D3